MARTRLILGLLLVAAATGSGALASEPFPYGEALRPRVEFWKQIYSRYSTDQVVLHDAEDLGVVYQVVNLEGRQEWREIEHFILPIRERHAELLRQLADGVAADGESAAILARFGPGVTPERLRRAAGNVRAQRGQADAFLEGLIRRGAYEVHLRRIFQVAGMPQDLTILPHVESSFRLHAYSRSGAAGIWQSTRSTGRHFMRVSHLIDERWDPIESTSAAARLLRRNYSVLGTWPLAITAYNHGMEGMKRAVARTGTTDLPTIIERYEGRSFGFASKNFYAEFLAAREVARNAERYFGAIPRWPPLVYQEVKLERATAAPLLLRALSMSICDLVHYNPALRPVLLTGERPLPAGYRLKVPLGQIPPQATIATLIASLDRPALRAVAEPSGAGDAPARVAEAQPARPVEAPAQDGWLSSLPGPGPASLRSPGFSDAALLRPVPGGFRPGGAGGANRLPSGAPGASPVETPAPQRTVLASGARWLGAALPLPLSPYSDWQAWMSTDSPGGAPPARVLEVLAIDGGTIRVEPEENLTLIAFWLGLSNSQLRQLNGLRPRQTVQLGQQLRVDFSRVSEQEFLKKRVEYQRQLGASFLKRHRITSTRQHSVRSGETLWSIARRYGRLPLWLLRWYNDGSAWPEPTPGSEITIPVVERLVS